MAQLAQLTVTMYDIQVQIKTSAVTSTNPTIKNRKLYCWIAEANSLMGVKLARPRKLAIKSRHTTKIGLGGVKKGVNDS